jgi:hypothetical protein
MRLAAMGVSVLVCCATVRGAEQGSSCVLHHVFDEGAGLVVRDRSGHGNDGKLVGGAQWVTEKEVPALSLNGGDAYVECSPSTSLEFTQAGTLEIWCLPQAIQGGLLSWATGSRWPDERLVLGFVTYFDSRLIGVLADGVSAQQLRETQGTGAWTHLALVFDGANLKLYRDGELLTWAAQVVFPVTKGVPLRIGHSSGLGGPEFFRGLVREVQVYNTALAAADISDHYALGVRALGVVQTVCPQVQPRLDVKQQELRVETKIKAVRQLAPPATLRTALYDAQNALLQETVTAIPAAADLVEVKLPTAALTAGTYRLVSVALDQAGTPIGGPAETPWLFPKTAQTAGAAPGTRIRNNLVVDLVDRSALSAAAYQEVPFANPRRGWIYVASTARPDYLAQISIAIDGERDGVVLRHRYADGDTQETLRYLAGGEHRLRIWTDPDRGNVLPALSRLVVRAVPEMMLCGYPCRAHLSGYGAYNVAFLEHDVLPNITTLVGSADPQWQAEQEAWKRRGGRWYLEQNIPTLVDLPNKPAPLTTEFIYDWWTTSAGFTNPYADGVLGDEFGGGNNPDYPGYIGAITRIAQDAKFKDKAVHAWCGPMYVPSLGRDLAKAVIAAGYKVAWEVYLAEMPSETAARDYLYGDVRKEMDRWNLAFPGFPNDLIFVLGILSAPPETCNVNPQVDYKVFLDLQFNYLANAPECYGLYGIMLYKASYAEEEALRWCGRLFRHYAIEGNTELLSPQYGYRYELDHIRNGDFDDGLNGWQIAPAEPDSIQAGKIDGAGTLFGRYNAPAAGNHFLVTRRCANRPNVISQEVKNLVRGQLYSLKMIVADHQDIVQGKSEKRALPLELRIDDVDLISSKSHLSEVRSIGSIGAFAGKTPPWLNHYRWVFRARGTSATLRLSDWAGAELPGGPIGQELMYNFIEVQPYFLEPL